MLVKWRASTAEDVKTYTVYMSLTPIDSVQNFAPVDSVPTGVTSTTITGLNPGVKYHFAVIAIDGSGHESTSKNSVSSRASRADPPETVRGLVAVQAGEDSARLTWLAVNVTGSPVVMYRVYMSLEPITGLNGPNVTLVDNATPVAEPSLLVAGLEQGTTYYFAAEAVDGRGRVSDGAPQVASVTLPVVEEEGPGLWETYGPAITVVLLVVIIALLAYVAVGRQRTYGRMLSRRPSWSKGKNGNGGT